MNWIHPFADGNGRTGRAVSYVVMSIKLDSLLPGTPTIPEQIASNKDPYYKALEGADKAWASRKVDVSALESLLGDMLAQQLLNAAKEASGEDVGHSSAPTLH
jgi:Fic family protein